MQLFVDHFFLGQQAGVFTQLLAERGNVPGNFIEHRLITGVLDRLLQLLDLSKSLVSLLDLALLGILSIHFAALVQAYVGFVHGLQHQARHLTDLTSLLDKLGALLALAFLEAISPVVRQAGLQHVQVVRHAGH